MYFFFFFLRRMCFLLLWSSLLSYLSKKTLNPKYNFFLWYSFRKKNTNRRVFLTISQQCFSNINPFTNKHYYQLPFLSITISLLFSVIFCYFSVSSLSLSLPLVIPHTSNSINLNAFRRCSSIWCAKSDRARRKTQRRPAAEPKTNANVVDLNARFYKRYNPINHYYIPLPQLNTCIYHPLSISIHLTYILIISFAAQNPLRPNVNFIFLFVFYFVFFVLCFLLPYHPQLDDILPAHTHTNTNCTQPFAGVLGSGTRNPIVQGGRSERTGRIRQEGQKQSAANMQMHAFIISQNDFIIGHLPLFFSANAGHCTTNANKKINRKHIGRNMFFL